MRRTKRTRAAILGDQRALAAASKLGEAVRASRKRRRLSQASLARMVGISRQRLGDLELGRGTAAPAEAWFAVAEALGRYLRFEFARDPQAELADAGHLAIQELLLMVAAAAGWERSFEAPSGSYDSHRSVDVRLLDRKGRRLVIGECWNTFGDLGASTRSSDRKLRDGREAAVALAGGGAPFQVGLVWVVRDTKQNREIVARYDHIFRTRFPGSSHAWLLTLTDPAAPLPSRPGLVWCNTNASRLFVHRRARTR